MSSYRSTARARLYGLYMRWQKRRRDVTLEKLQHARTELAQANTELATRRQRIEWLEQHLNEAKQSNVDFALAYSNMLSEAIEMQRRLSTHGDPRCYPIGLDEVRQAYNKDLSRWLPTGSNIAEKPWRRWW